MGCSVYRPAQIAARGLRIHLPSALQNDRLDESHTLLLRTDVSELRGRVDRVEVLVRENGTKLTDLKDEMQQRFRVVTERLSVLQS